MNKNDILYLFHFPNSPWGLRYRASKLEECPYRNLLLLLADLMCSKAIIVKESKDIIRDFREDNLEGGLLKLHGKGLSIEFLKTTILGHLEAEKK